MLWRRVWNALRPGRVEREIAREMSFHLAERTDDLRAAGLDEREAARRARAQFGGAALQAERARDMDVARWLDALVRDGRYAVRTLAHSPGFTATVVLTLAIAIGASTAVFSALNAVLLRPLPFPQAERLVLVSQAYARGPETPIAPARLEDWNRLAGAFQAIAGFYTEDASETSGDLPERVRRAFVSERFLETWGVDPARGRGFAAAEHRFGGPRAVLISDRYWRRRFHADPGVVGRTVRMGTTSIPVVGVMPATFRFPDRGVDLWSPVATDAPYAQSRKNTWYTVVGRLKAEATLARARENLAAVQARLGEQYPETDREIRVGVEPLKDITVSGVGRSLWLLFGAVSVLLLIACTNIAALLLSRAAHRRQEIAMRLWLGASRATIARQLLTETGVLALAGAGLGLLVAIGASAALRAAGADLPRFDEVAIDTRVLLYTLAVTVAVTFACGLLPAIRATGGLVADRREAGRTQVSGRASLQWLLAGAQVALSVTLLAAAGLLGRSLYELARVDPGFDATRVLTFRISGSWSETGDMRRLTQRIDTAIATLRTLPGVESVATAGWSLPGTPEQWETTFQLVEARDAGRPPIVAEGRAVSPEYFATMRIPQLAGEMCVRRDGGQTAAAQALPEVMVNGAFARHYLSGLPSPVGLHLREGDASSPGGRIVGVVGDARERGLDRAPTPTVYWCNSAPNPTPHFLLRTRGEPRDLAQTVRVAMKELEPLRSVYDVGPLEERIDGAYAENRLRTLLLVLFAATALSLACIGLYGTLSYIVRVRRREVGLRLALGALRTDIVGHFLGQGLRVVLAACACGMALSMATVHLLSGMLYGVSPFDPATLSGVIAVVAAIAVFALLLPAARAAFVEPMEVLREQ